MEDEIQALEESDTYDLITLSKGRSVVGGKWVYAVKPGTDNRETFKARYFAKGFLQIKDVDYQERNFFSNSKSNFNQVVNASGSTGKFNHRTDRCEVCLPKRRN